MRFGYVTVIEAANEEEARSYAERCLQPDQSTPGGGGVCRMLGGGASISTGTDYHTGPVAAAIAADAYHEDEDDCERLADELHAAAIQ